MNKQRIALTVLVVAVAAAGGYGMYQMGMQQGMRATSAADTATPSGKKPLYWHDPMVPGQKFDKPGKSPFMDMQLEPVYADDAGTDSGVSVSPQVRQNLGLRVAEVTRSVLANDLVAVGSVAYNERDTAMVQARGAGFVERLFVRAPLDPVRKGQPLLELYVPDWIAAQEEFLGVQRLQGAGTAGVLEAARQRMRLAGIPEDQIRRVETSGKVVARMIITAPTTGVVTELSAREGMTVAPGAPLFRIGGLSTVWVLADVAENAAARLLLGMEVEAAAPALPGLAFKGRISAILPQVDAATRTIKARIELANPDGKLVPGMFTTVKFAPAAAIEVLQVPSEALIRTGTRTVVILVQANGQFQPVEVEPGMESNGETEIRKGLQTGQKVVVSGQFLLDSEASLKGTATRMEGKTKEKAGAATAPGHHAEGKIEQIANGNVTISHGPVASLGWGPMTMDFAQPAGGMPRNIAVGDTIAFDFIQGANGAFQLTAVSATQPAPRRDKTPGARK